MSLADYLMGLALWALMFGSVILATVALVRGWCSDLGGAPLLIAAATIATVALIWVHLLPGMLGVLGSLSVSITAVATALVSVIVAPAGGPLRIAKPLLDGERATELRIAAFAVISVVAVAGAYLVTHAGVPPTGIDTLTFYLPGVASWIQDGTFWEINQFVPHLAHGNYPNNGDVVILSGVLPWENDAFTRFTVAPFVALLALSVYACGRELGGSRATTATLAAAVCAIPVVLVPALREGTPDVICLFGISTGLLFLLRHSRSGRVRDLIVAGLALGLAFGTKWYGVSSVSALIIIWALATAISERSVRRVVRPGSVLLLLVLAAGAFWLIRNTVESGNPVFPLKANLFGIAILDAPRDFAREAVGFTISDYAGEPEIWRRYFIPALRFTLGFTPFLLIAAVVFALMTWLRRRRDIEAVDSRLLVTGAASTVLALLYTVTPYTALGPWGMPSGTQANTRYLLPAIVLAAPVVAVGIDHLKRGPRLWALAAVMVVCLDALRRGLDLGLADLALGTLALGSAALLGTLAIRSRRVSLAVLGIALTAVLTGLGYVVQSDFNDRRYIGRDRVLDYVILAPSPKHIGLTGTWSNDPPSPVLLAFGDDLANEVEFVGPFVRGMLRQYPDCTALRRRVGVENFDLIIVGRGFPVPRPRVRDQRCLDQAGYSEVARSSRFLLYGVRSGS